MNPFDILETMLDLHDRYEERKEEQEREARRPKGSFEERLAAGLRELRETGAAGAEPGDVREPLAPTPPARRTFGRKGLGR